MNLSFYQNKHIFITGHTGFKGIWLCKILEMAGAIIDGYALAPKVIDSEGAFKLCGLKHLEVSVIGDIQNFSSLKQAFDKCQPDIVIHLAAQPIVFEGYCDPVTTYSTNVMGTVNILECIRRSNYVRSFLNVTTDKVYLNQDEEQKQYQEKDILDGFDPYSNSKSCSELVTYCYKNSFFADGSVAISTARAGNVIGGGDFSEERIIPECIRAAYNGEKIIVRNPDSIRPYQHVLDALYAYLLIVKAQYEDIGCAGPYNVGPDDCDCVTTGELVDIFCRKWGGGVTWEQDSSHDSFHEAKFLKLDCTKLKTTLDWHPRWNIEEAVEKTVEWAKAYYEGGDIEACMERQIREFFRNEDM